MGGAVDLFADRDTVRSCVPTLKQKPTEDSNLRRKPSVWLIADGERLANSRWTSDSCIMAALKPTWLYSFSITATDYVMSCYVMLCQIISYHTNHSVISHIKCGHCTYCVSCHTVRDEDAIITGFLLLLLLLLLLFTDYFTECYCRRLSNVSKALVHPHSEYF